MGRRLFISIDFDMEDAIRDAQTPFFDLDGIRLVDPSQVHVTLKFLGEMDGDRVDTVDEALRESVAAADVPSFNANVGGYGVFPSHDYISVIWIGVRDGGMEMHRLHDAIESQMVELGFDPADHEFTPHATIARMDHAEEKSHVQNVLQDRDPDIGSLHVSEVCLTESTLTPDGPEYETVSAIDL
jgi:2'-5' RNA ligase